jgi:F-type H+-transporting ATPase subunit b
VSPALANFAFETANVLLLAAALGWLLFKPVRSALDRDKADHDGKAAEAARLRAETERLAEEARTTRAKADSDNERQRKDILAAARQEADRMVEEARTSRRVAREALLRELEATRAAQTETVAGVVGRIAAESVRRLLATLDGPALDVALVRAACDELRAIPESARRGAVVESARPLDGEARALLQGALGSPFEERVVRELGAGARVTTSAGQVDASALSLAREASRAVTATAEAHEAAEGAHA